MILILSCKKLNFKINVVVYNIYMLSINNKLSFIDSFQFLTSLAVLVKSLSKDDFKYLSKRIR